LKIQCHLYITDFPRPRRFTFYDYWFFFGVNRSCCCCRSSFSSSSWLYTSSFIPSNPHHHHYYYNCYYRSHLFSAIFFLCYLDSLWLSSSCMILLISYCCRFFSPLIRLYYTIQKSMALRVRRPILVCSKSFWIHLCLIFRFIKCAKSVRICSMCLFIQSNFKTNYVLWLLFVLVIGNTFRIYIHRYSSISYCVL
jgi:hypothetical protein